MITDRWLRLEWRELDLVGGLYITLDRKRNSQIYRSSSENTANQSSDPEGRRAYFTRLSRR